ncbi:MAG: hypothetical protein LBL54_04475 [Clostridiales Family XIII bacterium]|nr:hypothetical protein [Clostridiales Family XIII bacterium]
MPLRLFFLKNVLREDFWSLARDVSEERPLNIPVSLPAADLFRGFSEVRLFGRSFRRFSADPPRGRAGRAVPPCGRAGRAVPPCGRAGRAAEDALRESPVGLPFLGRLSDRAEALLDPASGRGAEPLGLPSGRDAEPLGLPSGRDDEPLGPPFDEEARESPRAMSFERADALP